MILWINNIPIPPSVNDMYETTGRAVKKINKNGKIYTGVKTSRYGSKELQHFKAKCKSFYNLNYEKIDAIAATINGWIDQGYVIKFNSYACFERSRLWTLDNKAKQIDADNRKKGLQDSIADMLKINDKYFFSGIMEKVSCDLKEEEQCIVSFEPMRARTMNDIKTLRLRNG